MFRNNGFFSSKGKEFSWWWFGIKVGVVTALIVWWWLENRNKKLLQEAPGKAPRDETQEIPLPVEEEVVQIEKPESDAGHPAEPDDLTKIEGIGPKINAALQKVGLITFVQLAASQPAELKQILTDAGIRSGYPDTWPEQATLAAKADWGALEELQSSLRGGRRVN